MKASKVVLLVGAGGLLFVPPLILQAVEVWRFNRAKLCIVYFFGLFLMYTILLVVWMCRWRYFDRGETLIRFDRITGESASLEDGAWKPHKRIERTNPPQVPVPKEHTFPPGGYWTIAVIFLMAILVFLTCWWNQKPTPKKTFVDVLLESPRRK